MKNIIKSWLPVVLWAAIIFFFSANTDPYRFLPAAWRSAVPLPAFCESFRACEGLRVFFEEHAAELLGQLLHFFEYAVLAFLVARALNRTLPTSPKIKSLTIIIAMIFALSDEIHQLFVPGRAFQLLDLFIDFIGSLFGVYVYTKIKNRTAKAQRHEDY